MKSVTLGIWDRVSDPATCRSFIMPLLPMSMAGPVQSAASSTNYCLDRGPKLPGLTFHPLTCLPIYLFNLFTS